MGALLIYIQMYSLVPKRVSKDLERRLHKRKSAKQSKFVGLGRGSEFGETVLALTYRISEALGLCIASGARTVSVPGFAVSPDEVRSREAELPARPG